VVDVAAVQLGLMKGVQAVAFRQEVLERGLLANGPDGTVGSTELGIQVLWRWRSRRESGHPFVLTGRVVVDHSSFVSGFHLRVEIREMVESAGSPDGRVTRGVEAEEIDAGFALVDDIRSNIQLGKAREAGNRRRPASADSAHAERNDSDPTFSVEGVER